MKLLGIITARGNNKRLPGKNMADLGGKPLIRWSIDCGKASCDQVIVTTDDPIIADYSVETGTKVVHRPAELSRDDTPSAPVVLHAAAHSGFDYDAIVLLQPTSPFRLPEDVQAARQMAERHHETVISVSAFQHQDDLCTIGHSHRLRQLPPTSTIYQVNGAIYLIFKDYLLSGDDWYACASAYVMPPERSLDIDTHTDMDGARALLAARMAR